MWCTGFRPGVLGLHDHIEQHDGNVVFVPNTWRPLAGGRGMQEAAGPPFDQEALHRQLGGTVRVGIVIDDQDAPRLWLAFDTRPRRLGVVHEVEKIVVRVTAFWHVSAAHSAMTASPRRGVTRG